MQSTLVVRYLQGVLFNWTPPKLSKYKIPLYPLALREISEQLTWDFVLRKFRGVQLKRTPCTFLDVRWDLSQIPPLAPLTPPATHSAATISSFSSLNCSSSSSGPICSSSTWSSLTSPKPPPHLPPPWPLGQPSCWPGLPHSALFEPTLTVVLVVGKYVLQHTEHWPQGQSSLWQICGKYEAFCSLVPPACFVMKNDPETQ